MNVAILILSALCKITFSREYGLLFPDEDSYFQAGYLTFCDESSVSFEVLINRTSGVIIYAENPVRGVKLIVYFERPGMYINVTDGKIKSNLQLTLDFFSNQWFGWHEIQVRINEHKMFLTFDSTERHTLLQGKHLFPESVIEDNEIYFGSGPYYSNVGNVSRFSGYIKNLKYKSCGCNEWKPIRKVKFVGVSTEDEGECRPLDSCKKECVCYLFSWGRRRCECPTEFCLESSDEVGFRFQSDGTNTERLHYFNKSATWISSNNGPFGNGMAISAGNSLVLNVVKGRTCFKNIFLCENGFSYSLWMLFSETNVTETEKFILKHSSSIEATHGVTVIRFGDNLHANLTTFEGATFSVRSKITLSVWNKVTLVYNQSHLGLYVNSLLMHSTHKSVKSNNRVSNILSTRFLFIGNNRDTPHVTVDNLRFSTNVTINKIDYIEELRLEQYSDLRKVNLDCVLSTESDMVDMSSCYERLFGRLKMREFYISLNIKVDVDANILLVDGYFIQVRLNSIENLIINFQGQSYNAKFLRRTNGPCYLEISLNSLGNLVVIQNMHKVILDIMVNLHYGDDRLQTHTFKVNSDFNVIRVLRILNVNRDFAAKSLRILTHDVNQHLTDFDNQDSLLLTEGVIHKGILLKHPRPYISLKLFPDSCIRYIASCYHGLTIAFWLKLQNQFQDGNDGYFGVFSSGHNGITILIDKREMHFIVLTKSRVRTKFVMTTSSLSFGQWSLIEVSLSQNGIVSLYFNRKVAQRIILKALEPLESSDPLSSLNKCNDICLGDGSNAERMVDVSLDGIRVWDSDREFLYANGYISLGLSGHKLISFSNYQLNNDFTLQGSAKIISNKFGYALGLINFGPRYAIINDINGSKCFSNLDLCRRGLSIRMSLRPDNLAIHKQIILSSPFITVAINLEYLVIQIRSLNKVWMITSKGHLKIFVWHLIDISWHRDNGLTLYINGKMTDRGTVSRVGTSREPRVSQLISIGKDVETPDGGTFAMVIVDDIEFFEGDRTNLAEDSHLIGDSICDIRFNFDNISKVSKSLGIIGSAGVFQNPSPDTIKIPIPKCFSTSILGCKMCFTLRLWLNIRRINVEILKCGYLTVSSRPNEINLEINNVFAKRFLSFSCRLDDLNLLNKWNFFEVSWDFDEGLLLFVNREGVMCDLKSLIEDSRKFYDNIEISKDFVGFIDEIEMYHQRISILYRSQAVNESNTLAILETIKERERIEKEVELLKKALHSASINRTVEIVDSFQFNGSNYVSYKLPKSSHSYIPGGREEVEISFKSFNNTQNSVIWISDSKLSKNALILKNKKLYFTKIYILPSSNKSRGLTEELEIHDNIVPNVLHHVVIYQSAGEIVIKTTSMNESNTQSILGRHPLLPLNSNIYFGGYNNQQFLKLNQLDSSLFGLIYKARIKEGNKGRGVDIIQEMAQAKLDPNIENHGNVLINKKIVQPNMFQKTSFLASLSSVKISLMIKNPFVSVSLPKINFNVITSIEIEFTTYESRGQILFIGNKNCYISLEIYDSTLYFIYKNDKLYNRISGNGIVNNNKVQNVYIGRDLSGYVKVYFNRDEVMTNSFKFEGPINCVAVIGHIGKYDSWPLEVVSRIGFLGCIHFIRIDNGDFVNFSRNSEMIKFENYNLYDTFSKASSPKFLIGTCMASSSDSCQNSPCRGGWCQLTVTSDIGELKDNFKCDCLYSSKSVRSTFNENSVISNFNLWIYEYLLQSRSKTCSEDTKELVIVDQSFMDVSFLERFPFVSVLDYEFLIWTRSSISCVTEFWSEGGSIFVIISDGKLVIEVSNTNIIPFPKINLNDNQWHGIEIKMRLHTVQVKIDYIQKNFTLPERLTLNILRIQIGNCKGYLQSNFKIKGLNFNRLNLLNYIDHTNKNLFYTAKYNYPEIRDPEVNQRRSRTPYPVILLNNFQYAINALPLNISWFTELNVAVTSKYPGALFHIFNGPKFLSCIMCQNDEIIFVHGDKLLKSKLQKINFSNTKIEFKVAIDLLRQKVTLKKSNIETSEELLLGMDSWNIGDSVYIQFGANNRRSTITDFEGFKDSHRKCLEEHFNSPFIGCLSLFSWSSENQTVLRDYDWNVQMLTFPSDSVIFGKCQHVEKCLPQTCDHGRCISKDHMGTYCDCTSTDFMGERCHLAKDKCSSIICENGGQCLTAKNYRTIDHPYCNCSGTGFVGERCDQVECTKDFCLNRGKCYLVHNRRFCNCNMTMFIGDKCEIPTCKQTTCNGHGTCRITSDVPSPSCQCYPGYSGDYCDKDTSVKCETVCQNGGKCSSYNALMTLCENKYCTREVSGNCSCDHTLYKGDFCEEAEIGFNSSKDVVLLMENVTVLRNNYLRVLFEAGIQSEEQTIVSIMKTVDDRINLNVLNGILWIKYYKRPRQVYFERMIGEVNKTNVLILSEGDSTAYFYFNNKVEKFRLRDLLFQSRGRSKRGSLSSYPAVIFGCEEDLKNCFEGVIAGIRWNDRLLMDPQNKVYKNGQLYSIRDLQIVTFPTHSSFFIPRRPVAGEYFLIVLAVCVIMVLFVFYIARKLWGRSVRVDKVYINDTNYSPLDIELIEPIEEKPNLTVPESSPELSSQEQYESALTVKSLSSSGSSEFDCNRILLVNDIEAIHRLNVINCIPVPGNKLLLFTDYLPEIQISQNIFPSDSEDILYRCVAINVAMGEHYVYGHMCTHQNLNSEGFEIQAWRIGSPYEVLTKPPNVRFTHSVPYPDSSYLIILLNNFTGNISLFDIQFSTTVWNSSVKSVCATIVEPLLILSAIKKLVVNHELCFEVVDLQNDSLHSTHRPPLDAMCKQIIDGDDDKLIILTDDFDLYHWSPLFDVYDHKQTRIRVTIVAGVLSTRGHVVALGMETGEVYLSLDSEGERYMSLEPRNDKNIVCLTFSKNGGLLAAGFENNIIHVWRLEAGPSLCHFHAIHERGLLSDLCFSSDNRKLIVGVKARRKINLSDKKILIVHLNYNAK